MQKLDKIKRETHLYRDFSGRRTEIDSLKIANQQFEDLCNDYDECVNVLKTLLQQSNSNHHQILEYKSLRESLEAEIIYFLNHTKSVS